MDNLKIIFKLFNFSSWKTYLLFFLAFVFNMIGALLEGLAYCFVILAFTALSQGQFNQLTTNAFLGAFVTRFQDNLFIVSVSCGVFSQILKSAFCFLAACMNGKLAIDLQYSTQVKVYQQILSFSYACVNRYKVGELVEYLRSPVTFVRPFLEALNAFIVSVFLIIVSLSVMIKISLPLTVFSIGIFSFSFFLQKFMIRRSNRISKILSYNLEKFSSVAYQSLNGLKLIHLYNFQKKSLERLSGTLKKFSTFSGKFIISSAAVVSINEVVGIVLVSLCLIAGNWMISWKSQMVLPSLLGFVTVAYRLSGKVLTMMTSINQLAALTGSAGQIKAILEEDDKEFALQNERKVESFNQVICFKNIKFNYPLTNELVINGFNYEIAKGSVIGIVGSSGAGKSTLLDLLVGLYQPHQGQISIDGTDLTNYDLHSWRDKIGVVSQDTYIFNDTIEENIRFGKLEATEEEIHQAAQMANADQFIGRLAQKYKTIVGERGHRLSGGERQRLALCRALIRNPDILILDEATSNLDTQSEDIIQEALEKFKGKKTLIIVAHRLSTIKSADKILVLEKGRLIEQGNHDELINAKSTYAHFWNLQFAKK